MSVCDHVCNAQLKAPSSLTPVYKEECTQCFDDHDMDAGIDVCLTCFNGGCPESPHCHAHEHAMKTGHHLTLNMRRVSKDEERPAKLTKLEIKEEKDETIYQTFVRCWGCSGAKVEAVPEKVQNVVQAVMHAVEASKGGEIKAWSEEVKPCDHFENLEQQVASGFSQEKLHQCSMCDKRENLWMCLTCGHAGCGRRQYDGSGGNNHAIAHFEQTGHSVSVKLGTITPEGTADAYCYKCDDNKMDPHLAQHLQAFGISVLAQQKTEKSIAELQLEQNLALDFSMTTADGIQLQPVAGPGLTGMRNLGNSCYLASIVQCVFGTDRFRDRYFPTASNHFLSCTQQLPAQCMLCQLHKLAYGLWSGRYAILQTGEDGNTGPQKGISPAHFKAAIARDHPEFASMRQQDAFEFLQHLTKQVTIAERTVEGGSQDPTSIFNFTTEERLQCTKCNGVRYKTQTANSLSLPVIKRMAEDGETFEPISIDECFRLMTAEESVEGYRCPACNEPTTAVKSTRFASFPKVLAVQVRRFEFVNWVPHKLDIPIQVPLTAIDLASFRGNGLQPNEVTLPESPEDTVAAEPNEQPPIDEDVVTQLESMGFPRVRCVKAVIQTGNSGAEAAMNWIFAHMDDPNIDVPDNQPSQSSAVDPAAVEQLMAMGFPQDRVESALRLCDGDSNRALDRLLSTDDDVIETTAAVSSDAAAKDESQTRSQYELTGFVLHKGTSVHCGHYVATVRQGMGRDASWFFFNDAKVAAQPDPQPEQAYVYFFTRCD
ncbi:ubiquitin C-terminal hydrolase Ubp14 [Coemansia brasiliensis]|uniref:Ubiquitin carboxyl-terminal hydrolase n=1 Tax=Coemansia brasiliensis TaxID=2650707 RepID=A0A9W8M002_9FUNG|nr:ubiquitin C-terminal hydrolase Ubp14 [Coemansia brasiliensis]